VAASRLHHENSRQYREFHTLFEQNKPIVIQKSSWLKHLEAELKRFKREKSDRPWTEPRAFVLPAAPMRCERQAIIRTEVSLGPRAIR